MIGENGTGKTHLLKLGYAVACVMGETLRRVAKAKSGQSMADKLVGLFRPDRLGRLCQFDLASSGADEAPATNEGAIQDRVSEERLTVPA